MFPHPKASCSYWQSLLAKCRVVGVKVSVPGGSRAWECPRPGVRQGTGWWHRLGVTLAIRASHSCRWCFPRGRREVRTGATARWLHSACRPI